METKVNTPPREAEPIKDDIEHHKIESRNAEIGKEQSVSPRIGKPEGISPKTRPAHENVDLPRKEVQKTDVGIEKRDKVTEEGRIRDQKPITALRSPFNPSRSKTARSQHVTQSQEEDVDLHPGFRLPSLSASRMARQAEIHRPRTRTASLDIPRSEYPLSSNFGHSMFNETSEYPSIRTLPRPAPATISVLNEPASPAVSTAASTRTVSQPVMARSMYNQSNISISTDPMGTGLQRQIPSRPGKDWHRYKKADGYQT
ncbi:hypothetical protein MPH_10337 [Macrophomina phaseolina MS6]|uniref:Uncharacterized protein n=1 Tax=Macrophomina phaseolina (strain MS6) TaxID=1126212 RepID=K2RIA4_MACPH|nr:hypothetical protein MPH_10337 [Macrophomina phaseolina MS6]